MSQILHDINVFVKNKFPRIFITYIIFCIFFITLAQPVNAQGTVNFPASPLFLLFPIILYLSIAIVIVFLFCGIVLTYIAIKKRHKRYLIIAIVLIACSFLPGIAYKIIDLKIAFDRHETQKDKIQAVNFEMYVPTYLPKNIILSDISIFELSNRKTLVLLFENTGHAVKKNFSFLMYEDNGVFSPPQCGYKDFIESIEKDYSCRFFIQTPTGIEIYREEYSGPYAENYPKGGSYLELNYIFFKIDSTVFISLISANEDGENPADLSMYELIKMVDSFQKITPDKIIALRSEQNKIKVSDLLDIDYLPIFRF